MRRFLFKPGVPDGGLNNCDDETLIANNQLSDCQNVVFDENQFVQKRPSVVVTPTGDNQESRTHSGRMGKGYYTYKKKDGSVYQIVFTTVAVDDSDVGAVYYSTDTTTWTLVYSGFNAAYQLQFASFADKLIMTNGFDDVRYWAGPGSVCLKIGQPSLVLQTGGAADVGKHYFKATYEKDGVTYDYEVPGNITTDAGHKTVSVANIPLPPDVATSANRKVWATKADNSADYFLAGTITNDATTFTFNAADSTLTEAFPTENVASAKVPKARFPEGYDNRLFMAHTTDGPSEAYWSEVGDFENFLPSNVLATTSSLSRANETLNDGEYCSGLKFFKGMNQLLLFKKTGLYIIFPVSDRYDFRAISPQGCTLDGSIQEFHIEDEHVSRDSIIYANDSAIWEYTGHTVHEISRQPNGSSITATFKQIKQRFIDYKKNIKTTTSDFEGATIPAQTPTLESNYATPENEMMDLENLFDWKNSGITDNVRAYCFDTNRKRLYAVTIPNLANSYYGAFGYFVWNRETKTWGSFNQLVGSTSHLGIVVKMTYDKTTDRVYLLTTDGTIWRTDSPTTTIKFDEPLNVDMDGDGKTTNAYTKNQVVLVQSNEYRYFTFNGALKYQQVGGHGYYIGVNDSLFIDSVQSSFATKGHYFYVPESLEVFNPGDNDVYLKHGMSIDGPVIGATPPYDYKIGAHSSETVRPGLYCVWAYNTYTSAQVASGSTYWPDIGIYYKRPFNYQLESLSGVVYVSSIKNEAIGSTFYSSKIIKKIDLSSWTGYENVMNVGYGFVFLKTWAQKGGSTKFFVSYTDAVDGDLSVHGYIRDDTGVFLIDKTDNLPKQFGINAGSIWGSAHNVAANEDRGFTVTATPPDSSGLSYYNASSISAWGKDLMSPDLGANKNLNIVASTEKSLFYVPQTNGSVYEWDGTALNELGQSSDMAVFSALENTLSAADGVGGTTTKGRHRFKVVFEYNGVKYAYKEVKSFFTTGSVIEITNIPQGPVGTTHVWVYVSLVNDTSENFWMINNGPIVGPSVSLSGTDSSWASWALLSSISPLDCQTYYDMIHIPTMASGVPSMLMTAYGAGDMVWHGVAGKYKVYGEFLFTGESSFDTGADHYSLLTMEVEQDVLRGTIEYDIFATQSQDTLSRTTSPWLAVSANSGEILEGKSVATPSGGSELLSLAPGAKRYVHQYVKMMYDVNSNCSNSLNSAWLPVAVKSIVVNYLTAKGGSTVPVTNVTSAVLGKYYYLAVTLPAQGTNPNENRVNNAILVLDRQKRWSIWKGRSIHPASFSVVNGFLRWTDSYIDVDGNESDFIYTLTNRDNNTFADMYILPGDASVAPLTPIDAWYITKNFRELAPWDSSLFKKHVRSIFASALRGESDTPYTLTIGVNFDEKKEDPGTGVLVDSWVERSIDLRASDEGKRIKNVNFPAGTSGHRVRYRFRNNELYKDLSMIDYEVIGFTMHRRAT